MLYALYARLETYADGHSFARGGKPKCAACVREALEHYLVCPQKRQTRPLLVEAMTEPTALQSPPRRLRPLPVEAIEAPIPQSLPRQRKRLAAPAD
jgi:hypothetical protein